MKSPIHRVATRAFRSSKRAFTLVELLVVVAVMALLLSLAVGAFRGGLNAASPTDASDTVSAAVLAARSQALTLRSGSRVAIDAEFDSAHPDRYLRQMTIERWERVEENGAWVDRWVPTGTPISLPENVFFSTEYSSGYTEPSAPDDGKFVYEFDSAGRLNVPSGEEARMVFVVGILDSAGALETPAAMLPKRNGFIVRRAGRVAHFESPDQITPTQP